MKKISEDQVEFNYYNIGLGLYKQTEQIQKIDAIQSRVLPYEEENF